MILQGISDNHRLGFAMGTVFGVSTLLDSEDFFFSGSDFLGVVFFVSLVLFAAVFFFLR